QVGMPPRRGPRIPSREAVSNEASSQPRVEAPRNRGRVRRRGQARRGRAGVMPEVEVPRARRGNPTLAELA
ncbi:hypothetical protein A2U01_0110708, partial [Trifolium medium]|nr:hypothetical protein [Trifolium medium]